MDKVKKGRAVENREKKESKGPAVLVWNHRDDTYETTEKYQKYLISKLNQKSVVTDGIGAKCVHPEDEEQYRSFINSEGHNSIYLRVLNTDEKYERLHINKATIYGEDKKKAYTLISFYPAEDRQVAFDDSKLPEESLDKLTGLMCRGALDAYCASQKENDKSKDVNAVGIICIDQYGELRKQYSSDVLDEIVLKVSKVLKKEIRNNMLLVRYWEDVFVICCHGASSLTDVYAFFNMLAEKIRIPFGDSKTITVSVGVAKCNHDEEAGYLKAYENARKGFLSAYSKGGAQSAYYEFDGNGLSQHIVHMPPQRDIFIRTLGHFDVFINGEAILFRHEKSKELLALLVAHRGGFVSADEIITSLWENESVNKTTLSRCRKTVLRLKTILEEYGIGDILVSEGRGRRIDASKIRCDFIEQMEGGPDTRTYSDLFMQQYSWSEWFKADADQDE